jgi:hypothetical protein
MMRPLRPFGREGSDGMVLAMVAAPFMEAFHALVREFGGEVTVQAAEGEGPYRIPIYEMAWGHTRMHVNRDHPEIVGNVGLYLDPDLIASIERSHRRFSHLEGMHFEVKRFDGKLSFQGSPYFRYTTDDEVAEVMRGMTEDGAMVANNHTFLVKQGGMKSVGGDDLGFKRAMDPHYLMNPGKLRFDDAAAKESTGGELTREGWQYKSAGSEASAAAQPVS